MKTRNTKKLSGALHFADGGGISVRQKEYNLRKVEKRLFLQILKQQLLHRHRNLMSKIRRIEIRTNVLMERIPGFLVDEAYGGIYE